MPYKYITDLPEPLRHVLPNHAQKIYLSAFNKVWNTHENIELKQREVMCHKIAWSAVKKEYEKKGVFWVKKDI